MESIDESASWEVGKRPAVRPEDSAPRRWGWRPELIVESLEQRQLLSITPSYNPVTKTLTFTDPANLNDNLTLGVSSGDIEYSTDGVNFSQYVALTDLSAIVVHLGSGNDTLNIAPTLSDVLSTDNITVQDAGGTGQNTLASLASAADATQTWNLSGAGTGTLDGQVRFGGVANLVGGYGTDNFVLGAGMQGSGSDMTITAGVGDNATLDFSAYTAPVTVDLSAGTATDLASVTDLINVIGGSGLNTITGDSENSTITAGPGDNVLTAGSGLDTFVFNADVDHGNTQIYGGTNASTATLDFSPTQNTPITVDLSSTAAQAVTNNLSLTLESGSTVNDVIGGASTNTITANSADDDITAGTGDNVLTEGTGLDTFTFDADADSGNTQIYGTSSDGMATLDFSPTQSTAINVDLSKTVAQDVTPKLKLTLEPGNTVDQVIGGQDANTFTPNNAGDVLQGGGGTNTYMLDADLSLGPVAIETTEGAVDTLDFAPTQQTAVTVDLSQGNPQTITSTFSLLLEPAGGITGVIGGQAANTVTGNSLNNVFTTGPGNNTFTPGSGNDTVAIDADTAGGTDLINAPTASGGTTTLDFLSTKNSAVTVSLASTAAQQVTTNLSLTLAAGNDAGGVIGGAAANTVTGNGQNDVFIAGPGNNTFTPGSGNDTFAIDADTADGTDRINAPTSSGGTTTLDFSSTKNSAVKASLASTAAQQVTAKLSLTLATGNDVDGVIGGGGASTVTGNGQADTFTAGTSNNTLIPGSGAVTFLIDADTDQGSDVVDAGAGGAVTLNFSATQKANLDVNLSLTSQQTIASGLTLTLGTTVNGFIGGAGNDTITAGPGGDTIDGGGGNNTFAFDADNPLGSVAITDNDADGVDTLDFSGTQTEAVSINLGLATAQPVDSNLTLTLASASLISNVKGGGGNNTIVANNNLHDTITAGTGNNTITGGAGLDTFAFNADLDHGSQVIYGVSGGGPATLDFSATQTTSIDVNLALTTPQTIAGMTLTLEPGNTVENLVGGAGNDTLTGNAGNNILTAGKGNDSLVGGGGSDVYVFPAGFGNDTIEGTTGGAADAAPTIVVSGDVSLQAGSTSGTMRIVAQDGNTITVPDPATSLTIDADGLTLVSVDPSLKAALSFAGGDFTINQSINLGSASFTLDEQNINLTHSVYTTGDISLTADAEAFTPDFYFAGIPPVTQSTSVDISGTAADPTVLVGDNVTIKATANNAKPAKNAVSSSPFLHTVAGIPGVDLGHRRCGEHHADHQHQHRGEHDHRRLGDRDDPGSIGFRGRHQHHQPRVNRPVGRAGHVELHRRYRLGRDHRCGGQRHHQQRGHQHDHGRDDQPLARRLGTRGEGAGLRRRRRRVRRDRAYFRGSGRHDQCNGRQRVGNLDGESGHHQRVVRRGHVRRVRPGGRDHGLVHRRRDLRRRDARRRPGHHGRGELESDRLRGDSGG